MRKKTLTALTLVALCLVAVAVALNRRSETATRSTTAPVRRLTIAQAGDFYLYAPLYLAIDRGFFRERGLDVSLISTGGDEKTWAAVLSKEAQFGVADPTFVAVASQRGQPGLVVATIVNGVPFWGITHDASIPLIERPEQLRPYVVATFPAPSTAYTLQGRMFELGHLPPRIREGGFGTLLALLIAKQADIALELEPNVSQAVAKGYKVVYSLGTFYGDFTITGLTTTPEYIRNNRGVVGAVVSGINDALAFLRRQPEQSASTLARRFPEIEPTVAINALNRVLAAGILPSRATVMEDAWRKALQLRVDAGDLRPVPDAMTFVDNTFATEVDK